jgi:SPP1 gp7 family putative phage head morphogenesis protein
MKFKCGNCREISVIPDTSSTTYICPKCNIKNKLDYPLKCWLGFSYSNIKSYIINAVARDVFKDLRADTKEEYQQGYLSKKQVSKLRGTMIQAFDEGKSINWITKELKDNSIITSLYELDSDGQLIERLSADVRSYIVARTESTRLANLGNLDYYKSNGFDQVRFISAVSERTCPDCEALNGTIMSLSEAAGAIPLHVNCRCTTAPVTELD